MTDFLFFLKDNWNIIVDNKWTFLLFGFFVFLAGWGASWAVHSYLVNMKIHNIPEREELQNQVSELKAENQDLKNKLERQKKEELIKEVFRSENKNETIGDVLNRNK